MLLSNVSLFLALATVCAAAPWYILNKSTLWCSAYNNPIVQKTTLNWALDAQFFSSVDKIKTPWISYLLKIFTLNMFQTNFTWTKIVGCGNGQLCNPALRSPRYWGYLVLVRKKCSVSHVLNLRTLHTTTPFNMQSQWYDPKVVMLTCFCCNFHFYPVHCERGVEGRKHQLSKQFFQAPLPFVQIMY